MPDLRGFLERIFAACGGAMPFDEFMALALYDAEHGYYTTGIGEVGGREGDFATSATLSAGLGLGIAAWIREESARHRWSGPVAVIEVGGGNGALAAGILKSLGWWRRRSIRYHLVEVSPVLRGLQRKRLGRSVSWHDTVVEALDAAGGRALLFSNELVDAFPAKWLRFSEGSWREVWVRLEGGNLSEEFRELSDGLVGELFSALALTDPPEGQRIEIHPSFRRWLRDLAPHWREGSMLTIDYGADTAAEIYARRPGGTLRAYHRHERIEGGGVYSRFGKQDLTCDVNFADLVRWGEELGWETVRLGSQGKFLERFGSARDAMADDGPGTAFRVLEQRCRIGGGHGREYR
ncbi:MAG: SAM-dependent methyltransferase [Verrucomicrobiae bacterium]|nr:SAM-dependent methyltransferase [Verrucomicrobiae bacterium]